MADTRELVVKINGDASGLEKSLGKVGGLTGNAGMSFTKMAGAVALGQAAFEGAKVAIEKTVHWLGDSVKMYQEAETASKELAHAVLDVTHGTQAQLKATNDLADSLSRKGVLDDDVIRKGLAQLSTFGLTNESVQKLAKSMADLTVNQFGVKASGEQAVTAANIMAKALNGNFGALEKMGIHLTNAQRQMIKFGTETQRVNAINEVLAANLRTNQATALETTEGKLAHLNVMYGNIRESIGKVIIDGIMPFVDALAKFTSTDQFAQWIDRQNARLAEWLKKLNEFAAKVWPYVRGAIKEFVDTLRDWIIPAIKDAIDWIKQFGDQHPLLLKIAAGVAAIALAFAINPMVTIIAGIITAIVFLHSKWDELKQKVSDAGAAIGNVLRPIMPFLQIFGAFVVTNIVEPFKRLWGTIQNELWPALKELWRLLEPVLKPVLIAIAAIIGTVLIGSIVFAVAMLRVLIDAVQWVVKAFRVGIDFVNLFIALITGKFSEIPKILKNIMIGVADVIISPFRDAFNWIKDNVDKVVGKLKNLSPFQRHSPSLVDLVQAGTREIKLQYASMFDSIQTGAGGITGGSVAQAVAPTPAASPGTVFQPTINVQVGMYAGMPTEKRTIAVELWREIVREARSQGVQLPQIGTITQ